MAFCSECGNDIGTDKFCSKCGKSSGDINPDIKKKDRDITKAVIRLKVLSKDSSSLIIPYDIKMYEEALHKISDEKFGSFSASLNRYKKVTEINRLLEIDQKVTDKMLERAYSNDFKKGSSNLKNTAGKALGFISLFIIVFGVFKLIRLENESSSPSNNQIDIKKKESSIPDGVSSSCFCMDALSGGTIYGATYEQKSKCRKMFICWNNAQADCLMSTSQIWYECIR